MAITNFIPEIWSAAVAEALQEEAVLAAITNRQYEGDAQRGNSVHVTGVVPPNIVDYALAGRVTTAQEIADDGDAVPIDQEKSFDFHVDDIDKVQAAGSFESWTTAAGRALANDADSYIAAQMIAGGTAATDTSPVTTAETAHDKVVSLRKELNQANVPAGQRFLAMNAEFEAFFLDFDSKITSVDTSGTPAGLREATIGRYMGFTLVTSNLLPQQVEPQVVAFWQPAFAYISQIDKVEGMRSHTKFADRIRGLHVYGAQVLAVNTYAQAVRFFTGPGI